MPALSTPREPVPIVLLRRSAKKAPDGSGVDVLVAANPATDEIARRTNVLMSAPGSFSQLVLRLDRASKRYLLADPQLPADRAAALRHPAFLFLSDRQGGFPVQHFWLEQPDGSLKEMRDVPFVDTVVDGGDLEPGAIDGIEQIYAHELGHLMMAALAGPAPRRASSSMHFMTVRTDPWTAFTEGFGEHFQPVALDHYGDAIPAARRNPPPSGPEALWQPRFAREQVEGCWICPANLRFIWWHGRAEQRMRDAPLRDNLFVRQPAMPARLLDDGRPALEARLYRDVIPPGTDGPLKNASQMLSSEGVIATLFYRLARDSRLQHSYREASFYTPFLADSDAARSRAGVPPVEIVGSVENVYLKAFDVMHRAFEWGDAPAIAFVSGWASRFPEDAAAVYDVFLDVTRGVTVEAAAASAHASPGYLAGLRDRLLAGTARLDGNLGRPLWVVSPGMTLGMGLYRYVPVPQSFTLDLNGADVSDLRGVPGVSSSLAASIVRQRDSVGAFAAVADLSAVPGMTSEVLERFNAGSARMEERFRRASERASERSPGNPTWMMNYLVLMVKGAYFAAAAWQFLRAAVVAGLAYLIVLWIGRKLHGQEAGESASAAASTEGGDVRRLERRRPGPLATEVVPARKRGWLRRGVAHVMRGCAVLAGGAAVAAIPLAASVVVYSRGILPTPLNMAAVGFALGLAAWAIATLRQSGSPQPRALPLFPAVGLVVASLVIGWMY